MISGYSYKTRYRAGTSLSSGGGGGGPPTITSSDGEPASLIDNGDGTFDVVIDSVTVGTITQAQINAGGFITVVAPVTGMSGNNVVLTTTGYVIHVGSTPIESDVEVLADGVVVGTALPYDATAYPTQGLEVRFSYSVGGDPFVINTVARAFSPADLFAASEQGFWFDPSDFSTMFQDTAATVPVTAVGQSVARINDKSGRGNNATQATAANRPILRQDVSGNYYLEFDGTNDFLALTSRLYGGGAATVIAAVQGASQADRRIYSEGNGGNATPIYSPVQTGAAAVPDALGAFIRFDNNSNPVNSNLASVTVAGVFNDTPRVVSTLDTGSNINLRSNRGTPYSVSYTRSTTTLNVASIGCLLRTTPSNFFGGRIYGIVGRAATSTAGERENAENWLAAKSGVALP